MFYSAIDRVALSVDSQFQVVSLCQEAALSAMHEDIASPCVCHRHFRCALGSVRPQTDPAMLNFYENYCKSGHHKGAPVFSA